MSRAEERLGLLGLGLPPVAAPVAAYVPALAHGGIAVTSGQLPFVEGALPATGKVGAEVDPELARELSALAVLNALAALKAELGDLDRVTRVLKVTVYVASAPDFTGQPGIANGASELLAEAFGEIGQHTRSAVGVAVLPLDGRVELDVMVAYE